MLRYNPRRLLRTLPLLMNKGVVVGRTKRSRQMPEIGGTREVSSIDRQQHRVLEPKRFRTFKEKYQLLETIGEGTYGVVYKAVETSSGRIVALKKIRTSNAEDGLPATSIREIKLLKCLSHPHIIQLHGVFHEPQGDKRSSPILLLEFDHLECDLRKLTKRFPKRRLPLAVVKVVMRQILEALEYCHTKQVVYEQIHRDIKPSNVLVHFEVSEGRISADTTTQDSDSSDVQSDKSSIGSTSPTTSSISPTRRDVCSITSSTIIQDIDNQLSATGKLSDETHDLLLRSIKIKLADFGLARIFPIPLRPLTHEVVTLWYRAPEIVLGFDHYSTAIDIWSTGCIFLELLYGRPIFSGDSEMETLYRTFQLLGTPTEKEWPEVTKLPCWKAQWPVWPKRLDRYNYIRENLDNRAKDLLDQMLQFSPERRSTATELLNHPWFNPGAN